MEEFKAQLKELKVKLKAAEKRAIYAEKTVKIFAKELDKKEGKNQPFHVCFLRILIPPSLTQMSRAVNPSFLTFQIIC